MVKKRHPSNNRRRLSAPCHRCGVKDTPKVNGKGIGMPRLLCVPCYKLLHKRACQVARLPVFRAQA